MNRQLLAIMKTARATVVSLVILAAVNRLVAQPTLRITSPRNGAVVNSGQTLTVSVNASGTFSKVVIVGEGRIGFTKYLTAPPYQFSISIPANMASGMFALTAIGVSPGQNVYSDPVSVDIERSDSPLQYRVAPPSLNFDRLGESETLSVTGVFADGSSVDQSSASSALPVTIQAP